MSLIFIEGFDYYNGQQSLIGMQSRWTMPGTAGSSLVAGRFGGQAWWQNNAAFGAAVRRASAPLPSTYATFSCCFAFKWNGAQTFSGAHNWISWQNGAASHVYMWQNGGQLYFYNGGTGTLLATSPVCIVLNAWHFIEVTIFVSDTVGTILCKVDGATQVNASALDTRNGATTGISDLWLGNDATDNRLGNYIFDDIYMTDGASLGEMRVETRYANADTAQKQWTPNSGSNNYSRVNETLVDGDTTYVEGTTAGDHDLYGLAPMSSVPASVPGIQLVHFGRKTDAGTRAITTTLKSGAVLDVGADNFLSTSYQRYSRIVELDPNGAIPWAYAALNAMTVGPKVTI